MRNSNSRPGIWLFRTIVGVCGLLICAVGQAFPLFPFSGHGEPPDIRFHGSGSSYNADTDIFSAVVGVADGVGSVPGVASEVEFSGALELVANITESGELLSGSVSWVAGSADLGIMPGTTLLEGNIVDYAFGSTVAFQFQFLIEVTYTDPQLGFGPYAGLTLFHRIGLDSVQADPFAQDFDGVPWTHEDLHNVSVVPEPSSILLLGLGFITLVGFRYKRVKN